MKSKTKTPNQQTEVNGEFTELAKKIENTNALAQEVMEEKQADQPKEETTSTEASEQKPKGVIKKATKKIRAFYETGFVPTIAAMRTFIATATHFTPAFEPVYEPITIPELTTASDQAQVLFDAVKEKEQAENAAVGTRRMNFKLAQKIATRFLSQLAACGAPVDIIENANHWRDELRGKRRGKKVEGKKHISNAHTSYPNQAQSFENLLMVGLSFEGYGSNTPELMPAELKIFSNTLYSNNQDVRDTEAASKAARTARNHFFNDAGGFCDRGELAKKTVKAMFGATSPEYRSVSHLVFRKLK
ncbi:hypothetical protein M0G43_13495 [Subsaxibacter sp. CAU 1640]|uniref:hypothetical protein n=1 Tax=Subsaxibacter sp. CAU 1640 TaxID=2933271 RepID=UPI002004E8A8|nr:hypothetical protein [Subsaxibacter sp. CAU 1640]MCK7591596.1 hypothetical protein [Subsaxibacter sp. CAU 1640]